jgi:hypothetical protein
VPKPSERPSSSIHPVSAGALKRRETAKLLHDVEDRPGRDRETGDRDGLADPPLTHNGSEEGRRAADDAELRTSR